MMFRTFSLKKVLNIEIFPKKVLNIEIFTKNVLNIIIFTNFDVLNIIIFTQNYSKFIQL